jgi:hypothetical protein
MPLAQAPERLHLICRRIALALLGSIVKLDGT